MIVRTLPVTVIAALWALDDAEAFSSVGWRRNPALSRLRVAMDVEQTVADDILDVEHTVTDNIQDAVELLEDEDTDAVRIKTDMPKTETTKADLLSEIRDVMKSLEEVAAEVEQGPSKEEIDNRKSALMKDIAKKFHVYTDEELEPEVTVEEAAVSASLYMNPATAKIAPNLVITWEPEAAETLLNLEKVSNPNRPFMVGIVGIPGSGKSTSADILAALMGEERTIVMPMDGFHVPLAELAEFPNAADAIYRRGAPDTFHAGALAEELKRIAHGKEDSVSIPGFDHAVGDPTPDQHTFTRDEHRIVICEGIYLLHDDDGWENIKSFFDWTIYIDADVDTCIERLKQRNKCIPGYTPEEIEVRCDAVDRVNAETSRDGAYQYASQIVSSGASCH